MEELISHLKTIEAMLIIVALLLTITATCVFIGVNEYVGKLTKRAADVCHECGVPWIKGQEMCMVCGTRR